jgi:hypothetical protein
MLAIQAKKTAIVLALTFFSVVSLTLAQVEAGLAGSDGEKKKATVRAGAGLGCTVLMLCPARGP